MNGISAQIKQNRPQRAPCPFQHSDITAMLSPPGTREASPDTQAAYVLILDFPASEAQQNEYLLSKPPTVWYFVKQHEWTKICVYSSSYANELLRLNTYRYMVMQVIFNLWFQCFNV